MQKRESLDTRGIQADVTLSGEAALHFRKLLRHGRAVAALTPSGRALARACCRFIDPTRPQTIVELGAGTGAVTRCAAARMHPDSRLIAIERDPDFVAMLRASLPRAEALEGNAEAMSALLAERGVARVDVVLNGLPMPSLPEPARAAVLAAIAALPGNPWVAQITVMPWVFRRFYTRFFEEVRFELAWRNLPPAGVYHCRGALAAV
ncbi:methyltransferase domain-containing protein [Algiphilus aromaticivorans]|jgi:phosphatidylethanolamine/phosphatidyl-N-methylethanolamine N-methyltransferase|uniref:methyltransferase domain-containing protein n=1 Tax=Algiphilus aromaticivorans TaxID=382454 RepID=UPI0018DC2AC1|nr:methyltransferase domain-containing protein [Algiphilus aromaticivorans]